MDEQWLDVVGYEGIYQVSDLGRVRRVKGGTGTEAGRILNPSACKRPSDYPRVYLYHGSKESRRRYMVHILVAAAFFGSIPSGYETNHRDGNKMNSRLDNLEYVTRSDNTTHAFRVLGVGPDNTGSRNGQALLTADDVRTMRFLYSTGNYRYVDLAALYHISADQVRHIVRRRAWQHVQ